MLLALRNSSVVRHDGDRADDGRDRAPRTRPVLAQVPLSSLLFLAFSVSRQAWVRSEPPVCDERVRRHRPAGLSACHRDSRAAGGAILRPPPHRYGEAMSEQSKGPRNSWDEGALEFPGLSRVRLDALLQELLGRVDEIMDSQERLRSLLDAVVGIGADLDLNSTLDRIVTAACELVGARYGALGVVGHDGKRLSRFITHGVSAEQIAAIGPYPEGHGILGLLIDHPEPLRLKDLSDHPRSFGFPANHPPMRGFLGVPIRIRDQAFGNLYLTEKAGGAEFTEDDERTMMALAGAAGVVIDNARLYADTERRRRWHEVTAEITQLMLGDFDPQEALLLIAGRAREVSGSLVGAVLLTDGTDLVIEAIDGPPAFLGQIGRRIPVDIPVLSHVLTGDEQVVVEDLADLVKESGRLSDLPELEDLGRTILAPLPAGARRTGGILVVAAQRGAVLGVTAGTDLVRMFAGQATLALERAQAQRDQSVLAVLEDRDRIARDLHDLVIQRLFATGLSLQGATRLVSDPEVATRLGTVVDDLDQTIRDIRGTIFELGRTDEVPDLRGQIRDVVAGAESTLGFRPRLTLHGPLDTAVPEAVRPHLVAVLIETLSNAARHAQARQVEVRVAVEGSGSGVSVVATVSDDGKGFSGPRKESGLRNLRDRATSVGGSCEIESDVGTGTVVRWRAPLNGSAAD
jgi:signal transduction histidine kinase